jgi:hypothetical protein
MLISHRIHFSCESRDISRGVSPDSLGETPQLRVSYPAPPSVLIMWKRGISVSEYSCDVESVNNSIF